MRSFRKLTFATLVAVFVLIFVGGFVRSSGSGMGCPDWPKCFGQYIPPTSVSQLPVNYKEIYSAHRDKKNRRFAKILTALGMKETADQILTNPQTLHEGDFNPTKTRIEYINRLVGVMVGFLIVGVFVLSLRLRRTHRRFAIIAGALVLITIFQAWLGSIVVSTNLTPWTITIHMFLALLMVAFLVYLVYDSSETRVIYSSLGFWWLIASMGVLLVQVLLGTQVREAIDVVAQSFPREGWIANLGIPFIIHRSFSWIVLLLHVGLILKLRKTEGLKSFSRALILLILGTILTGMGMGYFGVPPLLQPVHLLLASVTFGVQFTLLLRLSRKDRLEATTI